MVQGSSHSRGRWLAALGSFVSTLVAQSPPAADTFECAGKHCVLVCHTAGLPDEMTKPLADQSLATLESFWSLLEKHLAGRLPTAPVRVHLHCRKSDAKDVTMRDPKRYRGDAFLDSQSEGHASLVPELTPKQFVVVGLHQCTVDALRRALAEQVLQPLLPANDPQDFVRSVLTIGLVDLAASPKYTYGVDGCFDGRRVGCWQGQDGGVTMTFEQLVTRDGNATTAAGLEAESQASSLIAQILASDSGWVRKLLAPPKTARGRGARSDRRCAVVEQVLGEDWTKNEARYLKIARAPVPRIFPRKPGWQPGPQRSLLVGGQEDSAIVQCWPPPPAGPYRITATCEIREADPGMDFATGLRFEVGWEKDVMLAVFFEVGAVSVREFATNKPGPWKRLQGESAKIEAGKPFACRIEVDAVAIRAFVDGQQVLTWNHGGRDNHQVINLAADVWPCWFSDLRIEPLGPSPAKK